MKGGLKKRIFFLNFGSYQYCITSNYRKTGVNMLWMQIFEWVIVDRFYLIHDDDWTFTNMDTKIGSPTFYSWCLIFIHYSYSIHTCFPIITSNANLVFLKFTRINSQIPFWFLTVQSKKCTEILFSTRENFLHVEAWRDHIDLKLQSKKSNVSVAQREPVAAIPVTSKIYTLLLLLIPFSFHPPQLHERKCGGPTCFTDT